MLQIIIIIQIKNNFCSYFLPQQNTAMNTKLKMKLSQRKKPLLILITKTLKPTKMNQQNYCL